MGQRAEQREVPRQTAEPCIVIQGAGPTPFAKVRSCEATEKDAKNYQEGMNSVSKMDCCFLHIALPI